ncbi:MAG: hypothetical protein A2Y23_03385 [Clostridiales bacterium GWB2_37_7]|nr:MAG: hypothetical protein A2Y23_03385 [Clostridiales bacterium GWB2_37_7]
MEVTTKQAKHIINTLKNGVVPRDGLELLRIGREAEVNEMLRCMDYISEGNSMVKFVAGEYGSGKSFLMSSIKHMATADNFIVAKLQIDNGFRFNSLDVLYYSLMHNLYSMDSGSEITSFEFIFHKWLHTLQEMENKEDAAAEILKVINSLNIYNKSFARAFLSYIRAQISGDRELASAAASWLTGEKNIPSALKIKFETIGSIDKTNSMDFLKAFIKLISILGYKGLVILVDEMELVMSERSDIRRVSYENLRYIIDICGTSEIPHCMFVFAGTSELFENPEKGIKTYEALAQRLGNAIDKQNQSLTDIRQPIIRLHKFTREQLQSLTNRVVELYNAAYNLKPSITNDSITSWTLLCCKKFGSRLEQLTPREYIIKLVEILDIMEQHPENTIFSAELASVQKGDQEFFINNSLKANK